MPAAQTSLWMGMPLVLAAAMGCVSPKPKISPPAVCGAMVFHPDELTPPARALPMSDAIKPPVLVAAINPVYPQKALENFVQGLMHVQCIITENGIVTDCNVILSLPHMDRQIVEMLRCRRYKPATLNGEAVAVHHDFFLWFVIAAPEEALEAKRPEKELRRGGHAEFTKILSNEL